MNNFLKLFVEVNETPKKSTPLKVTQQQSHPAIITMNESTISVGESPEYDEFKQQFKAILTDENKRNFPGNDYFEFVVMKNAMSAISQEEVKYSAAFAGWMTGGNQSKKSLLDTAKVYLGLVDKEISDFQEAYKAQHEAQIGKNETLIQQKTQKVQELTNQITQLTEEINSLRDGNQVAASALVRKYDAFMAAGHSQRQEILDEINNINQYIN